MTTTRGRRGEERGKDGNAARVNSCRSPRCHMMGAEVCTFVIFLASHLEEGGRRAKVSKVSFPIFQSEMMVGNCKADITIRESPSITKLDKFKETAREVAGRAP
jgi:hypothetical protein